MVIRGVVYYCYTHIIYIDNPVLNKFSQGAWDTAPADTSPATDWRSHRWRRLRRRVANVDTPNRRSPRRARPPVMGSRGEPGISMED